jgi:hypothetical protein
MECSPVLLGESAGEHRRNSLPLLESGGSSILQTERATLCALAVQAHYRTFREENGDALFLLLLHSFCIVHQRT